MTESAAAPSRAEKLGEKLVVILLVAIFAGFAYWGFRREDIFPVALGLYFAAGITCLYCLFHMPFVGVKWRERLTMAFGVFWVIVGLIVLALLFVDTMIN